MTERHDPLQREADAALALAEAAARGDPRRTLELFTEIVNLVDKEHATPPQVRSALARAARRRAPSIYDDPVYQKNARTVITRRTRVIGGVTTTAFPDCVAVGSTGRWGCTGTLVARNVVVTAAHCAAGGFAARVFLGTDVRKPTSGRIVKVRTVTVHPRYQDEGGPYDLAVLVLGDKVTVTPRKIARRSSVVGAKTVRVVGFGRTDPQGRRGYGIRRMVDVPMAAPRKAYGAVPGIEFVAGAPFLDRDSCNGDSGGPAYVEVSAGWALAGATSRQTLSADRACGDGGIYTRLYPFTDWIRSVPGGDWRSA